MTQKKRFAVGIDIGGTTTKFGIVNDKGEILMQDRIPSNEHDIVEDFIEDLHRKLMPMIEKAGQVSDFSGIGIGAPNGNIYTGTIEYAPNLKWKGNIPLADLIEKKFALPTRLTNDANAAAWAEWRFGAARGETHLVMITLGTGIGGAILIDGAVQRGKFGIAGEFGHMQVVPGGHRCECGNRGCWEQYASGNALVREARMLMEADSPTAHELLRRVDGDITRLTGPLITESAQEGDQLARELLTEIGNWLGVGIANLAAALDPGSFVVGGGVSAAGDLLLEPARHTFKAQLTGRGYRPEAAIVAASLGNEAGLIGAADLARVAALADGSA